jgi:hypothetical protein
MLAGFRMLFLLVNLVNSSFFGKARQSGQAGQLVFAGSST